MTLGTKLYKLREEKELSQLQIAEILDVSQTAYSKWESDLAKPNLDNLLKICNFYQIDIHELLDGASNIISNNSFKGSNIINTGNSTINMQSAEVLQSIMRNQEQINTLLESQNKLVDVLLKKIDTSPK